LADIDTGEVDFFFEGVQQCLEHRAAGEGYATTTVFATAIQGFEGMTAVSSAKVVHKIRATGMVNAIPAHHANAGAGQNLISLDTLN
jgi:hypothetical protein